MFNYSFVGRSGKGLRLRVNFRIFKRGFGCCLDFGSFSFCDFYECWFWNVRNWIMLLEKCS